MARRAVLLAAVVAAGCWAQPEDGGVPGPKVDLAPLTSTVGRTAPAARSGPAADARAPEPPAERQPTGGRDGVEPPRREALAAADERVALARRAAADASPLAPLTPAPMAPLHLAPPLGFRGEDGLAIDVDPQHGRVMVWETDAWLGAFGLHRAHSGPMEAGPFGRGWRAEWDARVLRGIPGGGRVLQRIDGQTAFTPVAEGEANGRAGRVYVSLIGEVEWLFETDAGYELADPAGRMLRFDRQGLLVSVTPGYRVHRAPGRVDLIGDRATCTLQLDGAGRVAHATGPGFELAYRYDADGELIATAGSRQRRYRVAAGRIEAIADGADPVARLTYDEQGRATTLTAGGARRTYHHRDDPFPSVTMESPAGTWRYRWGPDGFELHTPHGAEQGWLDGRGRLAAYRGTDGVRLEQRYDDMGTPLPTVTLDDGTPAREERDDRGRLTALAGGGVRQELAYDAVDRLVAFTTPDGAETVVDYHPLGGVEALTGPAGAVRTERDARGHVRRVTTPAGRSWSFEWRGEAVTRADGPMGPVRYRVGRDGSRTGWRDASGRSRAFVRDDQGRLTAVRAGDGAAHRLRYDAHGRLRTLGTRTGERLGFRYDRHGRLVEQRSGRRGEWVAIGYAQTDEGLRIETPFGRFAQPDGPRPDRLETPAGPFELRYDRRGRRETTRFPNGVVAHVERDRHGRTTRRCFEGPATNDDHAVLTLETHYDDAQRPARWSRDGAATLLGYDDAGRLSRVDGPGLTRRFLYDADGNRLSAAREGRTVDSRYDDRGRLVRRGDERLDYDGAGRLLRRVREGEVVANYGYDAFGRLAEVRRGQHVVAYGYDPLDRIATRTVDGRTERYVYEGSRLLAAVGPDGAARVFVYGPDGDEPLAYRDGDRWTFLHADARGTVLAYSDAAGRRVASASFSPFGELLTATDPDRPLFYAGRLVDREAGLIPMRTRFYAPELGRFLTPDPSGLAGGINAYVYVENRPLDAVDPLGLWPIWQRDPDPSEQGWLSAARVLAERAKQGVVRGAQALRDGAVRSLDALARHQRALRAYVERQRIYSRHADRETYGSTSAVVNLTRSVHGRAYFLLHDASAGALALLRDAIADDPTQGEVTAAADRAYRRRSVALVQLGKGAVTAERDHVTGMAALLRQAGHGRTSAAVLTGLCYAGEQIGVAQAHDAATGYDLRTLVDTGDYRELSGLERTRAGLEAVASGATFGADLKARALVARSLAKRTGRLTARGGRALARGTLAAGRAAGRALRRTAGALKAGARRVGRAVRKGAQRAARAAGASAERAVATAKRVGRRAAAAARRPAGRGAAGVLRGEEALAGGAGAADLAGGAGAADLADAPLGHRFPGEDSGEAWRGVPDGAEVEQELPELLPGETVEDVGDVNLFEGDDGGMAWSSKAPVEIRDVPRKQRRPKQPVLVDEVEEIVDGKKATWTLEMRLKEVNVVAFPTKRAPNRAFWEDRRYNCVRCATATDAALAGRRSTALPVMIDPLTLEPAVDKLQAARRALGTKRPVQTCANADELIEKLEELGEARVIVGAARPPTLKGEKTVGHAFNAVIMPGKGGVPEIRWFDAHLGGEVKDLAQLELDQYSLFGFFRTDGLPVYD